MLLDKIIDMGVANDPPPLTAVLRQCILLANQLKTPLLKTWAMQELNGYPDSNDVPEYRRMTAGALGDFECGFGRAYRGRPIPKSLLEPAHQWAADVVRLTEPVSSYEALKTMDNTKGSLVFYWLSDMVAYYQQRLLHGCVLTQAWQEVPKTAIIGVLDTVRTRVLTMAIDIKNGFEESDTDLNHIKQDSPEAERVQKSVVNNMYGPVYIAAGDQVINTQNIAVGNWDDLKNALKASGISDGDLTELHQAIQQDNKMMGAKVKGWISRNAEKVLNHGLQVGVSVGTTILTQLIKRHYGLPP